MKEHGAVAIFGPHQHSGSFQEITEALNEQYAD